jgi:hypothetical protein
LVRFLPQTGLGDELIAEETLDSLADARRNLAMWCYGYN